MTIDRIDFKTINQAALPALPGLLKAWLPDGRLIHREWSARNPTRVDHSPGSFLINTSNGKWGDFATGDRGGDVVSLLAYLDGVSQVEAAVKLSWILGAQA